MIIIHDTYCYIQQYIRCSVVVTDDIIQIDIHCSFEVEYFGETHL